MSKKQVVYKDEVQRITYYKRDLKRDTIYAYFRGSSQRGKRLSRISEVNSQ